MPNNKRAEGEKIRREVMGDEFVDRAFAHTTDFDKELQDFVCENGWGSTWTREGALSKRDRSLITIAFLTALRASSELKGHVRGALNNGCTSDEIKEVLLHASVYCGFPASVSAFSASKEIIEDTHAQP